MKFCAGHLADLGAAVRRRGYWPYVDEKKAGRFSVEWIKGTATRDSIDPLVLLMMELGAKAARLWNPALQTVKVGMHLPGGERVDDIRGDVAFAMKCEVCPLCVIEKISKNADAAGPQIEGLMRDVVVPIMDENGRRARA